MEMGGPQIHPETQSYNMEWSHPGETPNSSHTPHGQELDLLV